MFKLQDIDRAFLFEDFTGATASGCIDTGSADGQTLVTKSVSSTNTNTIALEADQSGGVYGFELEATDEAKSVALYANDELHFHATEDPVFQFRVQLSDDITTNEELVIGCASAYNATPDTVANNAWIKLAASMAIVLESDDTSTNSDDKASGVTMVKDTWYEFRVDCTAPTDVKFYYRTTSGGAWTELTDGATTFTVGAAATLQPYIMLKKASGTTTPKLLVDYVAAWQNRAA